MNNSKIIRVGVIGGGAIAQRRHLPEYAANPAVKIMGIYDPDQERAGELALLYNCRSYPSAQDLIGDPEIDAVSVCTPNHLHASGTLEAVKAGKHVLCEKPVAVSLDEARMMAEASGSSDKVIMAAHNQRLIRSHMKAKQLLSEGIIGDLLSFQSNFMHPGPDAWSVDGGKAGLWFFDRKRSSYGVMGDLGVHKIDLVRYLTGQDFDTVYARMMTLDKRYEDGRLIDLEDNVIMQCTLTGGLSGILHFSWTNYGQMDNSTVFFGTKGVMKLLDGCEEGIRLEMRDGTVKDVDLSDTAPGRAEGSSGVIDEFISAITEGRAPVATMTDGYYAIAAIESCCRSSKEGCRVSVRM